MKNNPVHFMVLSKLHLLLITLSLLFSFQISKAQIMVADSDLNKALIVKIHVDKKGSLIKPTDIIKMNFIQKNDRDSVLVSTYDTGTPQVFPVAARSYRDDINDVLTRFSEGDSATFKLNLDTMAFYTKNPRPPQFKNDHFITFTVKIEKVFPKLPNETTDAFQKRAGEYFSADFNLTLEKVKKLEPIKIQTYLTANNLKMGITKTGLRYQIISSGNMQRAGVNDTVTVNYVGRLIKKNSNNKYRAFDTNIAELAKQENIFQEGKPYGPTKMPLNKTVPGFSEAVRMIGAGGKIKVIIPAAIGYGAQGNPNVGIGPYEPMSFVIDVKNIKKTTPRP